jgi:hypothetical protein
MADIPRQRAKAYDISDWFGICARCKESLPVLHELWNEVVRMTGFLPDDHVVGELRRLLRSSILLSQHAIYSLTCVTRYSRSEASNTYEDYVQYYIYDFFGRIKSSSDILGLLVNHIYQLGIDEPNCALERGRLVSCLDTHEANKELAALINRARNEWLLSFYEMRNLVVHRSGIRFVIGVLNGGSLVNIQVGEMLRVPKERMVIERFLAGISVPVPNSCILDPVILCENLWHKWKHLSNEIMSSMKDKVFDFVRATMQHCKTSA